MCASPSQLRPNSDPSAQACICMPTPVLVTVSITQCPLALTPKNHLPIIHVSSSLSAADIVVTPLLSVFDVPGTLHTLPVSLEKLRLSEGGGVAKQQNLLSFILAQFTWHLIIAGPILKTIICSAKFSAFIATHQVVIQSCALLIKCFK